MARGDRFGFSKTGSNSRTRGNTMIDHNVAGRSGVRKATGDAPSPRAVDSLRSEKVLGRFFVFDEISGKKDLEVIYVTSSNLVMVAYSHSRKMMRVQFKNGSQYNYYGVPAKVMDTMKKVGSKGRFHYRAIRKRYPYQRVR